MRVEHLAEGVTLYCGDCREILPTLGKVDAVVTDPPYGVTQNDWDIPVPWLQLWPILEMLCEGAIVLSARQPFAAAAICSRVDRFRHEWIWRKNKASGHLNAKKSPLLGHETILVFGKEIFYHPQMTSGHEPGHATKQTTESENYGSQHSTEYGGSTQRFPLTVQNFSVLNNDNPDRYHPTQKPVDLMKYFIKTYSEKSSTILDPFTGSGTTGVAAVKLGRKFIGIEIEPKYFEIACRRISDALARPDLFIEPPKPAPKQEAML